MAEKFLKKVSSKFVLNTVVLTLLCFLCYAMGQWIIPFLIGFILAYAFHVPSEKLSEKLRVSFSVSAGIIVSGLVSICCLFTIFFIPLIKNASIIILKKLPKLINTLPSAINETLSGISGKLGIQSTFDITETFEKYLSQITYSLPDHIMDFLNTGMTLVYIVMFVFMTPIITFYLLKDWKKIEKYSKFLLNKFSSRFVIDIIRAINKNLGAYIRGQLAVCSILSVIYMTGIYIIGAEEFIICGLFSGAMSFAPFFGPFIGMLTTVTMAIDDFYGIHQYIAVFLLYIVVPFLDSNFITPRLIGKKTGIQPFWILFSICATVSVLGTPGIFISVPMAVILSTVCKEMMKKI